MKRNLPFIIIGVVFGLAIVAGYWLFSSSKPQTQTYMPTPVPEASPSGGQVAKVVLSEFGDYQCPPCGALHPELKKIKEKYGNQVRLDFYNFPLTRIHPNALAASQAAVAAKLQGKYWEMHNLLYESQDLWKDTTDFKRILRNFALQLKLNVEQFEKDFDSVPVKSVIAADMRRGEALGVTGTPTLFINGQLLDSETMTAEILRAEIDKRLAAN